MNKMILIAIGVILAVLIVGILFLNMSKSTKTKTPQPLPKQTTNAPTTTDSPTPTEDSTMKKEIEITLTSTGFSPAKVTIERGTTVVWTNKSSKVATVDSNPHPVHTSMPEANLGSFNDGETLDFTFTKPGTFNYHNHFNPTQGGNITVE